MSIQELQTLSSIFNNFAVGIAAILGGSWAGLKAVIEFIESQRRSAYKNEMKKRFPRTALNKQFKIVDHPKAPGKFYVIDLQKKERYCIQTNETLMDLGFSWKDTEHMTTEEFHHFTEGPGILTVGNS